MSTRDFTANVISATKVVPDGNFKDSKASGIWDINEALDLIKGGNWPNAANFSPGAFVDGLFQTHLYTGNNSNQTITNGIDLSGKGGLVWLKGRDNGYYNILFDTERGALKNIYSDLDDQEGTMSNGLSAFNSNGFTLGDNGDLNGNNTKQVSWTFRKQPKFFDVVTYTGTQDGDKTISHSLNTTVGMAIVRRYDASGDWYVYHRSRGTGKFLYLLTNAEASGSIVTATSDTTITLSQSNGFNTSGQSYLVYLFAHNDDDGGFGEPGDQDIIKCGTYTGNGNDNGPEIALGFDPQFFMFKKTSGTGNWFVYDTTRGWGTGASTVSGTDSSGPYLLWNEANQEATSNRLNPTSTGVKIHDSNDAWNENNSTFIYMAIRAGGMQTPTTASSVFSMDAFNNSGDPKYDSTHIVDMALIKLTDDTGDWYNYARPMRYKYLSTHTTAAEANASEANFDHMRGFSSSNWGNDDYQAWMWKRARGYFDVVTYTGTSSAKTVAHNLGVAPEMIWIKNRGDTENWVVYHSGIDSSTPEDYYLRLNTTAARIDVDGGAGNRFNRTAPTASVFTVGTDDDVNDNTYDYKAYLFATVAGVSKLGTYTGNDGSTNVDCGFTNGASFVLIKKINGTGDWFIFDSTRGIVAGNDPSLKLNTNEAEDDLGARDIIDPLAAGFTVNANRGGVNDNGDTFIFYAIA